MGFFRKGVTKRQQEVFEQIAIGNDKGVNATTAKKLIEKGLIEACYQLSIGRGFRIIRYQVPIPIHMEWCEWCATLVNPQTAGE